TLFRSIFPVAAVAVAALAVLAVFGAVVRLVAEVDERAQARIDLQDDVAALAAVAAVRPAHRYELFTPEADAAVAAVAGFHVDARFVVKQGPFPALKNKRRLPAAGTALCLFLRIHDARPRVGASRRGDRLGVHADPLAVAAHRLKLHVAVDLRVQREVLPHPHVHAGMNLGAALAHDNAAGRHQLAAVTLDAQPLAPAVAAVPRAAAGLLRRKQLQIHAAGHARRLHSHSSASKRWYPLRRELKMRPQRRARARAPDTAAPLRAGPASSPPA